MVFDSETSKKCNLKLSKDYKSNRIDYSIITEEENPFSELPMIKRCLDFLYISYFEVEENEADDYIVSIVYQKKEYEFIIVSTDTDFFQLLDGNTYVYLSRGKQSILYGVVEFQNKYTISPREYVLFKFLVGDKADHILGVLGIGKVTAAKIVQSSMQEYCRENENTQFCKLLKEYSLRIATNQKLIVLDKHLGIHKISFQPLSSILLSYKTYEIIYVAG